MKPSSSPRRLLSRVVRRTAAVLLTGAACVATLGIARPAAAADSAEPARAALEKSTSLRPQAPTCITPTPADFNVQVQDLNNGTAEVTITLVAANPVALCFYNVRSSSFEVTANGEVPLTSTLRNKNSFSNNPTQVVPLALDDCHSRVRVELIVDGGNPVPLHSVDFDENCPAPTTTTQVPCAAFDPNNLSTSFEDLITDVQVTLSYSGDLAASCDFILLIETFEVDEQQGLIAEIANANATLSDFVLDGGTVVGTLPLLGPDDCTLARVSLPDGEGVVAEQFFMNCVAGVATTVPGGGTATTAPGGGGTPTTAGPFSTVAPGSRVSGALPQTGSSTTNIAVIALLITAGGATLGWVARRRHSGVEG